MKIPEKVSPWLCILKHRNFLKPKLISVQNCLNFIFELYFNLCENGSQNCFKVAINWTVRSLVIQKEFYLLKVIGQRSTDIYFVSTPFLLVAAAAAAAAAVETKICFDEAENRGPGSLGAAGNRYRRISCLSKLLWVWSRLKSEFFSEKKLRKSIQRSIKSSKIVQNLSKDYS